MEDMLLDDGRALADDIADLLAAHKAINPLVLDLRAFMAWTDFFVIATVTSSTHQKGLHRHLKDYLKGKALENIARRKPNSDDEWSLVDLGSVVIHLMSERARAFYELERLWGSPASHQAAEPAR